MKKTKTIIFSYQQLSNVGCEIIIRGSIAFLQRAFPDEKLNFCIASYDPRRDRKILDDLDCVTVVPMQSWKRYVRGFLVKTGLDKWFWTPRFAGSYFKSADLFVSVGGDIYTMPGGVMPRDWLGWERFATRHRIPSIMFGANMEKIEVLSAKQRSELIDHFKRFKLLIVRDTATLDYLKGHGISENTAFFPDPIYSLRSICQLRSGKVETIGLNVSPYLLRDPSLRIFERISKIVERLVADGYSIRLIPHVYSSDRDARLDDRLCLKQLHEMLEEPTRAAVQIYDGPMSLRDLGHEISQTDLFIGARMHSCLNAVTLGIPTFFLAYSKKAGAMVSWLREGPLQSAPDFIDYAPSESVTLEQIRSLIKSAESIEEASKISFDAERSEGIALWAKVEQVLDCGR
jgi:polysaccharide pyruvyl transferase WcaK-like protein